ncbi:MalY/PatB family protein [Streptomyces nogalater]
MEAEAPDGTRAAPPADRPAAPGFDDISLDALLARRTLKWGRHGGEVLGAWVAEMDFPVAPAVREAVHEAVERGETGYPLRDIRTGLPSACADWLARTCGWTVPAERIFLIPDVLTGVGLGIGAYSRPGSAVVVPTPPIRPSWRSWRRRAGVPSRCPSSRTAHGGPWTSTPSAPRWPRSGDRAAVQPAQPLGRVFTRAELRALGRCVAAYGARVVADEIHAPLTYPGHPHIPYASVSPETADHTLTLVSAAKGWNIAGLKCAQAVLSSDRDVRRWRALPFHSRHGASTLGIAANIAAYRAGDPWRHEALRYLDGNRRFLARVLGDRLPRARYAMPEATYLAWLDCSFTGLDDPAGFLREARVCLSDGAFFGAAGRGFVRLNFATSRHILERITTALVEALAP